MLPESWNLQELQLGELSLDSGTFVLIFTLASVVGYLLSRLYFVYFRENEPQDPSLARSLAIITPALATLFWLIQHQLTLSLGLLGSLAVIRFRSPVKRAEDIAFVLVAITFSIVLSLQAWFVAAVLLAAAFSFAYLRNQVSFRNRSKGRFGIVTINSRSIREASAIQDQLRGEKLEGDCVSVRSYDGVISYVFNIPSVRLEQQDGVLRRLNALDPDTQINFYYPSERMGA